MKHLLLRIFLLLMVLVTTHGSAFAQTILYIPIDDRPVNFLYPAQTLEAAQVTVLMPPPDYVAGLYREGTPEKLWDWVMDNAAKTDALVVSADALLYGGLVDSRTHEYGPMILEQRLNQFTALKKAHPEIPLYVFSTIMRSPKASGTNIEPRYYKRFGGDIYSYMALQEKLELEGLTTGEMIKKDSLERSIPKEVLADWLDRRQKNLHNNSKLIQLTSANIIQYLIIGRDDTSYYSRSHKEWRLLNKAAAGLTDDRYLSFPGADQLGMTMLTRAYNTMFGLTPTVSVYYALGLEGATVPSYEDQQFGQTIASHILAAGGKPVNSSQADLVLAVNTPVTPWTEEAESVDNFPVVTEFTRAFVSTIEKNIAAGKAVAVVDVAFANGADNSLLDEMSRRHLLDKVSSYSGWNTASNTLGYSIGQGMMARSMSNNARKQLLAVRYLDDWAYQANIRPEIYLSLPDSLDYGLKYLSQPTPEALELTQKKLQTFAAKHLWISPKAIRVDFPWNRLFEIEVMVK